MIEFAVNTSFRLIIKLVSRYIILQKLFLNLYFILAKSKFLWTFAVPSQNLPLSSTFVDMVGEAADNNR